MIYRAQNHSPAFLKAIEAIQDIRSYADEQGLLVEKMRVLAVTPTLRVLKVVE